MVQLTGLEHVPRGAQHRTLGSWSAAACSTTAPDGDVTPYDPVFFPFDPDLHDQEDLGRQPVGRREDGPDVEEGRVIDHART